MRKLGNGQSVTFCVSPEMQKRIRTLANVSNDRALTVTDILVCAIAETWDDGQRSIPLWATQGIRHQYQEVVWKRADRNGRLSQKDVQDYLEEEAQSLEQRYRPLSGTDKTGSAHSLSSKLEAATRLCTRRGQVSRIKRKCIEFGLSKLDAMGNLQEEQERELAPEIEQERQVERPEPKKPQQHRLHPHVRSFAETGVLKRDSAAFMPAFDALKSTSASTLLKEDKFPSDLLVTADFARTVELGKNECSDAYQRPVEWVLTGTRRSMHMVVISPWEAGQLKPLLGKKPHSARPVVLRAYLPRSSLSFRSFEDLTVYTVPPRAAPAQQQQKQQPPPSPELVMQLNLFAGQLYLRSYGEYVRLCRYLGLSYRENEGDADVAADGFVGRKGGPEYEGCPFASSPVAFLGVLYKRIRRDCVDIEKTHMGRILAGQILRERDFDDAQA